MENRMGKILGYMLTWTNYGSWLQGDKRGYVKDGQILQHNPSLERKNKVNMKYPKVLLNPAQKEIIQEAIVEESAELDQKIYAYVIGESHIHLVTDCSYISAASAVSHYKNAARLVMKRSGFVGRLWTKGFSVRYCFDENQLNSVIQYVINHNQTSKPESPPVYPVG
jgi:hypothetical protein